MLSPSRLKVVGLLVDVVNQECSSGWPFHFIDFGHSIECYTCRDVGRFGAARAFVIPVMAASNSRPRDDDGYRSSTCETGGGSKETCLGMLGKKR